MDHPRRLSVRADSGSYVVPLELNSPQTSSRVDRELKTPSSIIALSHVLQPPQHPIAHFQSALDGTLAEYQRLQDELQQYKKLSDYQLITFMRALRWQSSADSHWHPLSNDKTLCMRLLYSNNLHGQIGLSNISKQTQSVPCDASDNEVPSGTGRQRSDFQLLRKFISLHTNTSSYISKRITYVQCLIQYLQDVQEMLLMKQRTMFVNTHSSDVFWVPDYCDVYNELQLNQQQQQDKGKCDSAAGGPAMKNSVVQWFRSIGKKEIAVSATTPSSNDTTPALYAEAARVSGFIDGYCVTRGMDCVPRTPGQVDLLLAYAVSVRGGAGLTLLDPEYVTLPHPPSYFFQQPILPLFPQPNGSFNERQQQTKMLLTLAMLPLASEEQVHASKDWVDAQEHADAMSSAADELLTISTEYLFIQPSYVPGPTLLGMQRYSTKDYTYPVHASKLHGVCEEVWRSRPIAPDSREISDLCTNYFNSGAMQSATLLHQVQDIGLPAGLLQRLPAELQIPIALIDALHHFLLGGCVQVHGQLNVLTLRGVFGNHPQAETLIPLCNDLRNSILRPNFLEQGIQRFIIGLQTKMTSLSTALASLGFTSCSQDVLLFAIHMLCGRIFAYVHEVVFISDTPDDVATRVMLSPIASYAKETSLPLKMPGTPKLDRKGSSREHNFFSPHSLSRHTPSNMTVGSLTAPSPLVGSQRSESYISHTPRGSVSGPPLPASNTVPARPSHTQTALTTLQEAQQKDKEWKKAASLHSMETLESLEVDSFLIPLDKYHQQYKYIPTGYLPNLPYETSIRLQNLMSQSEYATVQCVFKTVDAVEPTTVNTTLLQACRIDPSAHPVPTSNVYSGIEFTYLVLLVVRCLHFEADRVARVNKLIDRYMRDPDHCAPPTEWTLDYIDNIQAPSINADNLFPLVLYTVSQANISQPHYYLWLCKEQLHTNLTELGETGISNSLFEAAVMHLMNNTTAATFVQNIPTQSSMHIQHISLNTKQLELIPPKDIFDIESLSIQQTDE